MLSSNIESDRNSYKFSVSPDNQNVIDNTHRADLFKSQLLSNNAKSNSRKLEKKTKNLLQSSSLNNIKNFAKQMIKNNTEQLKNINKTNVQNKNQESFVKNSIARNQISNKTSRINNNINSCRASFNANLKSKINNGKPSTSKNKNNSISSNNKTINKPHTFRSKSEVNLNEMLYNNKIQSEYLDNNNHNDVPISTEFYIKEQLSLQQPKMYHNPCKEIKALNNSSQKH